MLVMFLSFCCHYVCHFGALAACHIVGILLSCGVCLVIMLPCCCHFGAWDDRHVVVILLSCWCILAMLLSFCCHYVCHFGALAACHIVGMLLSCGVCVVILLSFVVILVHSMIGMVLPWRCHFRAIWLLWCH